MEYRRAKVAGGTYFFTVVTEKRQKILCLPKNVSLLRDAFGDVMQKHPFIIDSIFLSKGIFLLLSQ
jgi:putative transposase